MGFPGRSSLPGNISRHGILLHEPAPSFILTPILVVAFCIHWCWVVNAVLRLYSASSHVHGWGSTVGRNREFPYSPPSADIGRGRKWSKLQSIQRSATGRLWGKWRWGAQKCSAFRLPSCFWRGHTILSPTSTDFSIKGWFSITELCTGHSHFVVNVSNESSHPFNSSRSLRTAWAISGLLGYWLWAFLSTVFSLHLNALFELARPVLGNKEKLQHVLIGSFTLMFWNPYPGFQNHICHGITRLKRLYFNLFLILFSIFSLACLKQTGVLETSKNVEFWLTQFFKFWTSHFDVSVFPS